MKHLLACVLAVSVLVELGNSLVVAGTVPQQITCQGQISKTGGAALSKGTYIIKARIWDNATGGNVMWGMLYPVNLDTNGSFNVTLGDGGGTILPAPTYNTLGQALDGGPRFVGITVLLTPAGSTGSTNEILPRLQLVSSPCALRAGMADYALTWNGLTPSQLATLPAGSFAAGGDSSVLGYDGANMNTMPLLAHDGPGLVLNGTATITGAFLKEQDQVNVKTDSIYPKSTNGIALRSNVTLLGSGTVRNWKQFYSESTDGFLIVPWSYGGGLWDGDAQRQQVDVYIQEYITTDINTFVLYSGATNANTMNSGYTLLPMPAGVSYMLDGQLGTAYFQSFGQ